MAFSFLEYPPTLEIFIFLYYANEKSDDVINSFHSKMLNQEISPEIWQQYSSDLAPEMCITKKKQNGLFCCYGSSLLLWHQHWVQSLSEKNKYPICNHLQWDGGSCSEHKSFPHRLNSPHWIFGSG